MTAMEGKVNRVRTRLVLLELSVSTARLLFYLAVAAAVVVFADKLFHLGPTIARIAAALGVAGAAAWLAANCRRVSLGYAARQIDGEFRLHERISTALAMARCDEPMLPALLADAERHTHKIDPSRFRFRPPRQFAFLPLPLLALAAGLWLVPPMDILGRKQAEQERQAERKDVKKQAEHMRVKAIELKRRADKNDLAKARKNALKMKRLAEDMVKVPGTKKNAMVKMSKLGEGIRAQREKLDRARKFDALDIDKSVELKSKIEGLDKAKDDMQKLADALRDGKLDDAAAALENLAQALKDGAIPPDEALKLAEALKELAQNMPMDDQLTQAFERLAAQLGAKDLGDLADLLEQMKLTQMELAELQKILQEMEACDFALDVLEYERMCLSCDNPGGVCGRCGKLMFICMGRCGGPGLGAGGIAVQRGVVGGRGAGKRSVAAKHPVDFKATKVQPNIGPGKILASQLVRGMPPEDAEARQEYEDVLRAASKMAEDAVRREDIPPQRREKIKRYFDDLQKK